MRTTLKLFKLQIDEMYSVFKLSNLKKLLFSVTKYFAVLLVLFGGVYLAASKIFIMGFKLDEHLIAIVLLLTQLVALIFAVGNIIKNMFQSSNNEILFTLPASANQIFLSKILVIYVREVIVNSMYTLPLLLALGIYKGFGAFYLLTIFPLMLLLPLLPLSLAALLSLPVLKLINLLKKQPIVSVVLMAAAVITFLVLYVGALSKVANYNFGENQLATVRKADQDIKNIGSHTFIFFYLAKGIIYPKMCYFIFIYAAVGVLFFAAAAFFIRPFFFKIAIASRDDAGGKTYNKKFKMCSPLLSLVKKEFLTGIRSPGYIFQYFIFAIIMPAVVLLYDKLLLSMDIISQTGRMMIAGSHVLIVAMFAMLSNIVSASAISREGGNFYILKTSPVSFYTQTAAKLLYNAIFSVTAIVLTCIVSLFARLSSPDSLSAGVIIVSALAALFAGIGHMCLSFNLDLKNPTLNWYDSGDITSVSANTTKSLLWAVAISIVMALIVLFSSGAIWGWLLLMAFSIALCVRQAYLLILRVSYQYDKQEM